MVAPAVPGQYILTAAQLTMQELVTLATVGPQVASTPLSNIISAFPPAKYSTAALESATIPAANVTGAQNVNFDNTGTTPGNLQFPTAAALIAALPAGLRTAGFAYSLSIRNSSGSANTATITTNTGITLTGTMTIAQTVTRNFLVTLGTAVNGVATTAVVQSMGISAAGA